MAIVYIVGIVIFLAVASLVSQAFTPTIQQGVCDCEECDA